MFNYLASGLLTRTASRRLARFIPNPLVRAIAIAAAAYGVERLLARRARRLPRAAV